MPGQHAADPVGQCRVGVGCSHGAYHGVVAGPSRNRNLPHVVLGRARLHHAVVAGRAHAQRGVVDLGEQAREVLDSLSDGDRRALEKRFGKLRSGRDVAESTARLADLIATIFARDDDAA